jgi:hypothetical protein
MSAAPASACYTGPLGVGFIGRTAKLSDWGEANLGGYALDRRDYPGTRVLVIFYGNGINSAKDRVLLLERQNAVRAYLLGQRVPQSDFTIAVTRKAPSALVVSYSGGTPPAATVELTSGCGR